MKLERINLFFGLLLLVVFLLTGYYMQAFFKPNNLDNLLMRLQIRSNHIYILFISLLNIISFKTVIGGGDRITHVLNFLVRTLLVLSGVLSFVAFIYEHTGDITNRMLTLVTVILSLTAVGLFLLNELVMVIKKQNRTS